MMHVYKVFLSLALCLTVQQGAFGRTKHRPFTQTIDDAQQGIAAVVIPGEYGIGVAVGTAFFVSNEYLLTAAHVLRAPNIAGLYIPMFVPNTKRIAGMEPIRFQVVEADDDYDIALLRATSKPRRQIRPFTIAVGSLPSGTEVAVTGYGSLADFPLTMTAFTASQGSMRFGSGLLRAQRHEPQFGRFSSVFVLDRPLPGGFSGAPVYVRDSGVVYGVAVEVRPDLNSGAPAMALAHPLKKAKEYMDKHHVQYQLAAPLDDFVNP
jgi:S1-C subfamily serine protease